MNYNGKQVTGELIVLNLVKSIFEKNFFIKNVIFVCSLLMLDVANTTTFYLGLQSTRDYRDGGAIVLILLISLVTFYFCIDNFNKKIGWGTLIKDFWPVFFIGITFLYAIISHGVNISYTIKLFPKFLLLSVPAYLIGFFCAKNSNERQILDALYKYTYFITPFCIGCFYWLFTDENIYNRLHKFYQIGYMSLGYIFYSGIVIHFVKIFVLESISKFSICFVILNIFLMLSTGLRAPVIFSMFLMGIIIIYITFCNINNKKLYKVFLLFVLLTTAFIVFPPQNISGGVNRTIIFAKNVQNNDIESNYLSADEILESLYFNKNINIGRKGIYLLTIEELRNQPIMGMLPFGFFEKYHGTYTHNILLDFFVDYGLIFGSILIIIYAKNILYVLNVSTKTNNVNMLALILISIFFTMQLLLSNYFIKVQSFWFLTGYLMAYFRMKRSEK